MPEGEFSPPKDPPSVSSDSGSPSEVRRSAAVDFLAGRTEGKMITYTDVEGDYMYAIAGRRMEPQNLSEPQGKAVYGIRVSA